MLVNIVLFVQVLCNLSPYTSNMIHWLQLQTGF